MQGVTGLTGWKIPLMFTVASVSLISDMIVFHHHSIFLNVAFGITSIGAVAGWTDYLYKRGRESARTLPGKLLPNGEDRLE